MEGEGGGEGLGVDKEGEESCFRDASNLDLLARSSLPITISFPIPNLFLSFSLSFSFSLRISCTLSLFSSLLFCFNSKHSEKEIREEGEER